MSPKKTNKGKTTTRAKRRRGRQTTAGVVSGAALVVASVLPAALNPTQPPRTTEPTVVTSTAATKPRKTTKKGALAFDVGCQLPFEAIETEGLTIDSTCSIDGNSGDDVGKRLESEAKNNFCVEGS